MKVWGSLDVAGLERLTADPVTGLFAGRVYFNTTDTIVRYYDGTLWRTIPSQDSIVANDVTNALINSDMSIAQRGDSFTGVTASSYIVDRWSLVGGNGATLNLSKQTSGGPGKIDSGYYLDTYARLEVTVADGTVDSGDFLAMSQTVEGYIFRPCAQRDLTFSFYVRSNKVGTYCVSLRNAAQDRSYVGEYTIDVADTWEYKTVSIPASPVDGTWNYDTGLGVIATFALSIGSTFQTTPGSWQTGNFAASSSQVNWSDTVSNYFEVTGCMLNPGGEAPYSLAGGNRDVELEICKRYFELYTQGAGFNGTFAHEVTDAGNRGGGIINYSTKRAIPTITTSAVANFSVYRHNSGGAAPATSIFFVGTGLQFARMLANTTNPIVVGDGTTILSVNADAEVYIDAEL